MTDKQIEEKVAALHLAIAKHKANEALQNLKANGVINNHTMASSTQAWQTLVQDYATVLHLVDYPLRAGNRFSPMFEAVFERTLKDTPATTADFVQYAQNQWATHTLGSQSFTLANIQGQVNAQIQNQQAQNATATALQKIYSNLLGK